MSEESAPYDPNQRARIDKDNPRNPEHDLFDPATLEERFHAAEIGMDRTELDECVHVSTLRDALNTARAAGLSERHQLMFACLALHEHAHTLERHIHRIYAHLNPGDLPINDVTSKNNSSDSDE